MKERKRSGTEEIMSAPPGRFYPHHHPPSPVADPEGMYSRPRKYETVDGVDVLDEKRNAHLT